jgi:CRP/FNR family nitrogen fixation transcriptional regulator
VTTNPKDINSPLRVVGLRDTAARPPSAECCDARKIVLARGQELFGEGEPADYFYRVVSGIVLTHKVQGHGHRQIDAFHFTGDILGLESGPNRRFSAEAATDAAVVPFHKCLLNAPQASDEVLCREILGSMIRSLEHAQNHSYMLGLKTARAKVVTFLREMSANTPKAGNKAWAIPQSDIADYLNLSRETVSRVLAQLAREGVRNTSVPYSAEQTVVKRAPPTPPVRNEAR